MDGTHIKTALQSATDTKHVEIGEGAIRSVEDVFQASFGERSAVVVADDTTFDVAGEQVQSLLSDAGRSVVQPYVFGGTPTLYAGYENIVPLVESLQQHDAIPVAVGSGSLNDIAKRAAYECDRPYMVVGTAASMDGYTAFGSSIAKDGHKQTLTCPAPIAAIADLDILVAAPASMTSSGYGDLLGKVPAGADWIIADTLDVEKIDDHVWSLVQDPLRASIGRPAELRAGDRQAMDALIEGLIMSGLAMQAHRSSRPASGAEHQFSHLWEMEGLGRDDDPPLSHGFKVGVGSVAIAALYERLLQRDLSALDVQELRDRWPSRNEVEQSVRAAHTTPGLDVAAVEQTLGKYISADQLAERLALLHERWPQLRERLSHQLLPAAELREMLQAAGCPTHPSEIGLSRDAFKATYVRAQMIRKRYTVLDLLTETNLLNELVDELFAPGGFWAKDQASPILRDGRRGTTAFDHAGH